MSNVINNNGATKFLFLLQRKKILTQFRAVLAHFIFSISHETRLHINRASDWMNEFYKCSDNCEIFFFSLKVQWIRSSAMMTERERKKVSGSRCCSCYCWVERMKMHLRGRKKNSQHQMDFSNCSPCWILLSRELS